MMKKVLLLLLSLALSTTLVQAQETEFILDVPTSEDSTAAYTIGINSGARSANGPYDLDNDGLTEVLVTDYTGGGRVHVLENTGVDAWELVYTTPYLDATSSTQNARVAAGADLDGDGNGEILFFCGWEYAEDNAVVSQPGICVFEFTGTDNDYGDAPASLYEYNGDTPDRSRHEVLEVADVDGDDIQEVLFANNGADNVYDSWYVVSVTGDIGSGFEAWVEELRLASRAEEFDMVNRGGGSPYGIVPADLDGDGTYEISMSSWNSFNFTNGQATGPDEYAAPGEGDANAFLQASPTDDVALFGGVAVDIDGNGDDEVFYPRFQSGGDGEVTLLNYEEGENVLEVTEDNVALNLISGLANLGIAAGDVDGDGAPELIGAGPSYSAEDLSNGDDPKFVNIAKYIGGDVEDSTSYEVVQLSTPDPADASNFNTIMRDSAGVTTQYFEPAAGALFPPKLSYLGDADGDGAYEIAVAFQGVADSISTFDEFWNPDSLVGVFNTPVDSAGPGPVGPGAAYEFSFSADPGQYLSFATMFIPSNDLFFAPADSGLVLFDDEGSPRSGDVTADVLLWDAGTELNEEPGVGASQPQRGEGGEVDSVATIRLVNDGFEYPAVDEVIAVTLTPADDGSNGFTLRIENVSTATTLGDNGAVPIAPGVYVVHTEPGALFEEGGVDAGDGLEALAEDGNPGELLASLQNEFGYFRTLVSSEAAPVRAFMRVIQVSDLNVVSIEDEGVVLPSDYKLGANYPNPFNPTTSFTFTLPLDKAVSVRIYDVSGRLVTTLVDNALHAKGTHTVTWDSHDASGAPVASGTYLYTLEYGNFRQTRKMVLLK